MTSEPAAKPTRIAGDDRQHYDGLEIGLHWATATFVVALWLISQIWEYFPRGDATRLGLQSFHVSLGLLFAVVLLVRILWRLGPGRRPLPATSGFMEVASEGVHYLLYGLLIAQVVLGVLWRWGKHDPLGFFALFVIPSPFDFVRATVNRFGDLHGLVANIILIVAGLHAAAALFHYYIMKDNVLWRMLPLRRMRREASPAKDART